MAAFPHPLATTFPWRSRKVGQSVRQSLTFAFVLICPPPIRRENTSDFKGVGGGRTRTRTWDPLIKSAPEIV